ncbi:hypothetical protein TrLO_g13212 [Triparma laevis f. longispina]|uniref:Uncharacterized protein n=1 Tax=Triparma laevis f. longispina TaxID=1714387 RepID=A0A9W7F9G8_9STRA|nr:hypothetical protein TrLO_g13212 [Triparma laevis f. longispina]
MGTTPMYTGTPMGGGNMSEDDDIDQSLDDNDQAIEDRRRSRSFFSETDVSSGLKSALPPQVGSSGARDSLGQPVIMVERTGALNSKEIMALREGLKSEMVKGDVGRDSDLDVDEEYERKRDLVNDVNHDNLETCRDTISVGGPSPLTSTPNPTPFTSKNLVGGKQRKVKILMLGDSGVGKTSLMSRWTEDTFNANLTGTLGVDFKMKQVTVEGCSVQVQVWDTAGQERFRKITTSYYKNANGIILVYDTCGRETFENISYWMQNIQEHSGVGIQVAVVGNKIDLREMAKEKPEESEVDEGDIVERKEGEAILKKVNDPTGSIGFYEASAKEKTGVDAAFSDLLIKVIKEQLAEEQTESEPDFQKNKKKKKKITLKRVYKGGKKVAKGEKCSIS